MQKHLLIKLAIGAALLGVAGCGGDDDNNNGGGGGPVAIQQQFGQTFAMAFNASGNADPIDPQPGDLPAVSFTTDPIDF